MIELPSPQVEKALLKFRKHFLLVRKNIEPKFNLLELRKEIQNAKERFLNNLETAIKNFIKSAEKKGAKVYYAKDKKAALKIIYKICKKPGAKNIVKAKSMATEEIHLNAFLEKKGFNVVETDLGEWIIQLSKEKPSHILAPAIHFTRKEVSELFSKYFEKVPPDPNVLVKTARKELRKKFLSADIGICGANIGICETGSFAIFTNEGNGRLVLNLSKVIIALIPIDKLVLDLKDAIPIIRALPKAATGQVLSSYVSFITGGMPHIDGTSKSVHIILLDNGREKASKDPEFRKYFYCIRCGGCANVCPVFVSVSGHVFGKIYTGPIGVILTAVTEGIESASKIASLCLGCKKCEEVCPSGVPISELIWEIKKRNVQKQGLSIKEKILISTITSPTFSNFLWEKGKPFYNLSSTKFFLKLSFSFLKNRNLPDLPQYKFSTIAQKFLQEKFEKKKEEDFYEWIVFYPGCLIEFLYPEIGIKFLEVLYKLNIGVILPDKWKCCGAPAYYNGDIKSTFNVGLFNLKIFSHILKKREFVKIISLCPTCTIMLKKTNELILRQNKKDEEFYFWIKKIIEKIQDGAEFLYNLYIENRIEIKKVLNQATYHDPCHLRRGLNIVNEPREIIIKASQRFIEMEDADECCGFAGSYALKYPEIENRIFLRKLKAFEQTKADTLITSCPACIFQWQTKLTQKKSSVKVLHLVEIFDSFLS